MTLQDCLKKIYYSLGGDPMDVLFENDINRLLLAIAALKIGAAIQTAQELPAAPEEDGAYTLTVTVADGEATYSWEAAAEE